MVSAQRQPRTWAWPPKAAARPEWRAATGSLTLDTSTVIHQIYDLLSLQVERSGSDQHLCTWVKLHVCSFHFLNTEILTGGFRMTPNHVVKLHTDINIYSLILFSFIYSSPSSLLFFASLQLNWRFEFNFFAWWNIMRLFLGSLYLMCAYFPEISYIISTLKIPLLVWLNVSLPTHYSTLLLQGEPPTASPFFNNSLSAYCVPINRNMTRNSALNT